METLPIGKRIALVRIARGVRQRDLSRSTDIAQSSLSAIETGHRQPRDRELVDLLDALHVTREDLERVRA